MHVDCQSSNFAYRVHEWNAHAYIPSVESKAMRPVISVEMVSASPSTQVMCRNLQSLFCLATRCLHTILWVHHFPLGCSLSITIWTGYVTTLTSCRCSVGVAYRSFDKSKALAYNLLYGSADYSDMHGNLYVLRLRRLCSSVYICAWISSIALNSIGAWHAT